MDKSRDCAPITATECLEQALGMCAALMGAHIVSRTWPLLVIRLLPHVGDDVGSKSKPLADQIPFKNLVLAASFCGVALGLCAWASPVAGPVWAAALVGSAIAFWRAWRLFAHRLQGFTGDCLGMTQQVCELAFYLGWALALGWVAR